MSMLSSSRPLLVAIKFRFLLRGTRLYDITSTVIVTLRNRNAREAALVSSLSLSHTPIPLRLLSAERQSPNFSRSLRESHEIGK